MDISDEDRQALVAFARLVTELPEDTRHTLVGMLADLAATVETAPAEQQPVIMAELERLLNSPPGGLLSDPAATVKAISIVTEVVRSVDKLMHERRAASD